MDKCIFLTNDIIFSDVHNRNAIMVDMNIYVKKFIEDNETEYIKMLNIRDGDGEPTYYLEDITPDFFLIPFEIHIEVELYFEHFVEEDEEEDEEDEEEDSFSNVDLFIKIIAEERGDIPTFKIFKVDNCVICLNNKLEIMFYDCLYCCVCSECEKVKPLMKCPYCRKKIIVKYNLTNPPNVSLMNCLHIAKFTECGRKGKSFKKCPICKTENELYRIIN